VAGNGAGVKEASDGFGGEIDFGDGFEDYSGDIAATERNKDEMAGSELKLRRIGERTAASTVDFSRYYLEKHRDIITYGV